MTATTIRVQMAQRKDTAANWTAANPILLSGEIGYETDTKKFKIGNGSTNWNSLAYLPIPDGSGNLTITGNLEIGSTGSLTFEGSTADGFETTLAVTNPTADRTITLPNQSGTVLVSGNASIIDADIAANAEIAVSKLADGTARQLLQTDAAGTGVEWASNVDIPGTLDVTGAATFDAAVTVAGDLTVNGTTTTISTQNLLVEDKNIIIGDVATPTDVTADGGGITLKGATDKTINWVDATDAWTSSERFSVPLGTAALPSLMFTGDTNTGIYSPGADQVAISTNGTGRLFVDASGNIKVSIGEISQTSATSYIRIDGGDGAGAGANILAFGQSHGSAAGRLVLTAVGSESMQFGAGGAERMRLDSSGRLGLGTSSPANLFQVTQNISRSSPPAAGASGHEIALGSSGYGIVAGTTTGGNSYLAATRWDGTATNYNLLLQPNGGSVGIGTTSPATLLHVNTGSNATAITVAASTTTIGQLLIGTGAKVSGQQSIVSSGNGLDIATLFGVPITFYTSDTERARIDASGRLLVGTSSSSNLYAIGGANFAPKVQIQGTDPIELGVQRTDGPPYVHIANGQSGLASGNDVGFISFNGKDSNNLLVQAAQISAAVDGTPGANDMPGRLVFSTTADGASSPTERLRINSLGVTQSDSESWNFICLRPSGANQGHIEFKNGGSQVGSIASSTTTTTYATSSDYRLKENVVKVTDGINRLQQLKPSRFNFTAAPHVVVDGFIAHEVQAVVPEAIIGEKDAVDADGNPVYQGIDQSKLVPLLTAALQEAIGEIESLKARLTAAGI